MPAEIMAQISIDDEPGIAGDSTFSINRYARKFRAREVMTTSDFSWMADLIDRGVMAGYLTQDVPVTYTTLGYRRDTTDLARAGGKGRGRDYQINAARLIPRVAEKEEYKPIDPTDAYYPFSTYKHGCQWDLSWEAYLADNRDLNMLMDYPQSWGLSARYTMEYIWTQTWAANAVFFTGAQGNYVSGAATALSATSLGTGISTIRSFADPAGNVGTYGGRLFLVVPPILQLTAQQILNSSVNIGGVTVTPANNPLEQAATLVVNHFLPTIDTVSGNTAWYLFCQPSIRPAVRYGFLQGYDEPEIFIKAADAQRLFGGGSDPYDGSFLDDDIAFKLRFTFGADTVDWRGAYMSKGAV